MQTLSVQDLLSASGKFDLFESSSSLDPLLLKQGYHPPLIVSSGAVVWGFALLRQARELGLEYIHCSGEEGDTASLLILSLRLENRMDRYSWKEKLAIFSFMEAEGISDPEGEISALVSRKGSFLPQVRKFLELPESFRMLVNEGLLDLKTALSISTLPESVAAVFLRQDLPLSFSQRRILMQMLYELWKRDSLGTEELLTLQERILADSDPLKEATKLRMPEFSRLEEVFASLRDRSLKGSGVELKAPPYFEGGAFSVSFSFRNGKQLAARISALKKLQDTIDELLSILR